MHAIVVVAFHAGIDLCAGIQDALVDDGDTAHAVIHQIVAVLCQGHTSGCYDYGALRNVGYAQVNLAAVASLVLAGKQELVVLGNLFGNGLGAVIQFREAIFVGYCVIANPFAKMASERFRHRKNDASAADGESFNIVELAVAVQVVVGVQTVQLHGTQQGGVLQLFLGDIGQIHARAVALILDVQTELLAAHAAGAQVVDVLHHQFPAGRFGASGGALQQLHEKGF